jgi:hypothetical protein
MHDEAWSAEVADLSARIMGDVKGLENPAAKSRTITYAQLCCGRPLRETKGVWAASRQGNDHLSAKVRTPHARVDQVASEHRLASHAALR